MTRPFPQFDPADVATPGHLVTAVIAWDASLNAEQPHVYVVYDPAIKGGNPLSATGPFPDAHQAAVALQSFLDDFNQPKDNDDIPVFGWVVQLEPPAEPEGSTHGTSG